MSIRGLLTAMMALYAAAAVQPGVAQPFSGGSAGAAVAAAPRLNFTAEDMALAEAVSGDPQLAAFYGANGLDPIFAGRRGPVLRAALAEVAGESARHGIAPERYDPAVLDRPASTIVIEIAQARILARYLHDMTGGVVHPASIDPQIKREVRRPALARMMADFAQAPDPAAYLRQVQPHDPAYLALQAALAGPQDLIVSADLPPAPTALWRVGMRGEGVLPLRERLASLGFQAGSDDPAVYDAALSQQVARYQEAVGLRPDGVAGPETIGRLNDDGTGDNPRSRAIAVAMERLRWMGGEDLGSRHVWVNIPEFAASIMDGGHEVFRTRVVVGKTDHDLRTPEFSDRMEYVVVNPRWNVPRSITVKEYLPRLKANRYAVTHLDIVDGRGNVIARDRIDFSRYDAGNFPYRMRQKPSDDNALGLVKFIFPNPWNIYLHDTPTKHLFASSSRAYSHGCVRVSDPFDLATQLLSGQSSDPRALFQRALDGGRETWLHLEPELPVHLVYFTAFPDQTGQIRVFPDIYGRDAEVWAALQTASLDSNDTRD